MTEEERETVKKRGLLKLMEKRKSQSDIFDSA